MQYIRKIIIYGWLSSYCLYSMVACGQSITPNSSTSVVQKGEDCTDVAGIDTDRKPLSKDTVQAWQQELFQKGNVYPDQSVFISVTEVKKRLVSANNTVLVDVRMTEEFSAFRMPNSINIQANQLISKSFLKNKSLILIDMGFSVSSLQTLIYHLKKAGFDKTWGLTGGLNAWRYAGEKLHGTGLKQKLLNRILPQDLYKERHFHDVTVLDVSGIQSPTRQQLEQLLKKHTGSTNGESFRIVISHDQGLGYEFIESIVADLKWPQVYFLQGGTQAYTKYMKSQWAIWNRPVKKQGQLNGCGRRNQ